MTGAMNHDLLPQVYCSFDSSEAKSLAKAFQAPVVTEVETNSSELRKTTESLQIPLLVYQAGEAMRLDQEAIAIGIEGITNVLSKLDMIEKDSNKSISPVFSKDDDWLTSHSSGILHPEITLGEHIKKGDVLGRICDPFSNENSTVVKSHLDGVIVGINRSPLIQEGTSIFKIASFIDNKRAEASLEKWEDEKPTSED